MLIDDLREVYRQKQPLEAISNNREKSFLECLFNPRLTCVEITDMAMSFCSKYDGRNKKVGDIFDDFFCLFPPSTLVWLDFLTQSYFPEEELDGVHHRSGALVIFQRLNHHSIISHFRQSGVHVDNEILCVAIIQIGIVYGKPIIIPIYSIFILNRDGSFFRQKNGDITHCLQSTDDTHSRDYLNKLSKHCGLIHVDALVLYAINMMNAKNIVLKKEDDTKRRRLNDKRKKQGKLPLVKMHTLDIVAPGKRVVKPGDCKPAEPADFASSRPLHLVRGHLADYRDGNGLFGKLKGVFYIPQHARGSIDNGIVKKRYELHPRGGKQSA